MTGTGERLDPFQSSSPSSSPSSGPSVSVGYGGRPASSVARPEVILEGLDGVSGLWREIDFRYKPGSVGAPPQFVWPHQPRLDWQMWFAALGKYNENPWLVHLIKKVLDGEPDVIGLLDIKSYQMSFPAPPAAAQPRASASDTPPLFGKPLAVRATLYLYDFTRVRSPWTARMKTVGFVASGGVASPSSSSEAWWHRCCPEPYLFELRRDDPNLLAFLQQHGWLDNSPTTALPFTLRPTNGCGKASNSSSSSPSSSLSSSSLSSAAAFGSSSDRSWGQFVASLASACALFLTGVLFHVLTAGALAVKGLRAPISASSSFSSFSGVDPVSLQYSFYASVVIASVLAVYAHKILYAVCCRTATASLKSMKHD